MAEGDSNVVSVAAEDIGDGKGILSFFRRIGPVAPSYPQVKTGKDDWSYFMRHKNRGKAVIFNHRTFEDHLKLKPREGTDVDASTLCKTLSGLGFKVVLKNDRTQKELMDILEGYSEEDHSDNDCFVVCVLTHGEYGLFAAKDKWYKSQTLWDMFTANKVKSLAGKPKIFLIQACQGDKMDPGQIVQRRTSSDGDTVLSTYKIPVQADFLIAYSTIPGYYSWRNETKGSWFIQSLCTVLLQHSHNVDLLSMMTVVCRMVALEFESRSNDPEMNKKRQIPCITSMLTRNVFFGDSENALD